EDDARLVEIPVTAVRPNPEQPRRDFDAGALAGLADSIRSHGVLQPIVVERDGDGFQLVAGERRLRAAALAGLSRIPAILRPAPRERRLTAAPARALLGAPTDADREELAEAIGVHGLSVRQVEHEVGRRAAIAAAAPASPTRGRAAPQPARLSADDRLLERSLEEALGAPVTLRRRRRGGQLIVDFHDDEQLDDLYTRLGGAP